MNLNKDKLKIRARHAQQTKSMAHAVQIKNYQNAIDL